MVTTAPPATPVEATLLALAIGKMDSATRPISAKIALLRDSRQRIVLSSAEWHAILGDLTAARLALRTQQIVTRRGAA